MIEKLVKIKSTQLEEVVKKSGIAIQEGEEIKQSYLPFICRLTEIQEQAVKINFNDPKEIDETIARELRLMTVKIRTGASNLKEDRKKIYLLKGNLEQAAYNLIAASCKVAEESFLQVEKANEIREEKAKQERLTIRLEKLIPYSEGIDLSFYNLKDMTDESFQIIFEGFKNKYDQKKEAERVEEELRLAKIEKDKKERERIESENLRLQKENEAKEKQLAQERAEAKKKCDVIEAKAKKDKEIIEAKLKKEQEATRKANEAKVQSDAELKSKRDAEEKIKRENEAREKAALLAPDKEKLIKLAKEIINISLPDLKCKESINILTNIATLLKKTHDYIIEKSNNL
jgi:hypothetical protein